MHTFEITNENIEITLTQNEIVILDFWAEWCGPCKFFAPIFEKVAAKHPEIKFGKVNTEEQAELAGVFGIRSIPTILAFRDNTLLFAQPGALPEEALEDLIRQIKALDMAKIQAEIEAQKSAE